MNKTQFLLLVILTVYCSIIQAGKLPQGIIQLDGMPATNFSITDFDGNHYELNSSRGKWVFLHFWASWCVPCRREMPFIQKLVKQNKLPIDIILINTAEDEDTIFSFLGSVAPELHSFMDRDGELTEIWQPRGLPTTYFIDPQGRKRYLALGGRDWLSPEYQNFLQEITRQK